MIRTALYLAVFLAVAPALSHAEIISAVAAVVNDEIITTRDVDQEARLLPKGSPQSGPADESERLKIRGDALQRLIDRKLVEQKIRELNIRIGDDEIRQAIDEVKKQNKLSQEALVSALAAQGISFDQYRSQLREQLERLRLISQEVRAKVQVTPDEVSTYYETNPGDFATEESFRARHIFFRLPSNPSAASRAEVRSRAEAVLAELRKGADFGKLASYYSEESAATEGGSLGLFKKADMLPEFQAALSRIRTGDFTDILESPAGFHILKIDEIIPGTPKPLATVKGEIEDKLYRKKVDERFSQWLVEMKKHAVVDIIRR